MSRDAALILWLTDVTKEDIATVGKHALSLGEMANNGFPIADGFVITSRAYYQFIQENNLADKINGILTSVSYAHPESIMQISAQIRKLFMHGHFSPELVKEIDKSYKRIGGTFHQPPVIVRSSVTARDVPTVTFAGHHHSFTDIKGEANLILKIRETWASFFDPQALLSRHHQQFDHFHIAVPVIIQKMVHPDKSGFMFTEDPFKGDKSKIIIEAVQGPVQPLLEGKVTPEHYVLHKKDLSVAWKEAKESILTENQLLDLALLGRKLDKMEYFPQSITWAIEKRHIYFLETKQLHIIDTPKQTHDMPSRKLILLLQGASVSPGLVTGPVRIIQTIHDVQKIKGGEIAVLPHMNIDFANQLKKAGAIITEQGGRTSHTSIAIRHMGVPAIVGAHGATETLRNGMIVTINATRGEIFDGTPHNTKIEEEDSQVSFNSQLNTATKVYLTLSHTASVEKAAQEHVNGVGLLKGEILMKELSMSPGEALEKGKRLTYTRELAEKIAHFAKSFYPRLVMYRFSDSGATLGIRGAYKHIHHQTIFKLETEAIRLVRETLSLRNLGVIIPVTRKTRELVEFKQILSAAGLHRSPTFKVWMTVATPSNVLLIDEFIKTGVDGVSIDTSELAMLTLGIDPKDHAVAHLYDEIDPSVLVGVAYVITAANKHRIPSTLSGLAPSLYPSLLEKAVTWGVTAVSVSPDVISSTRHHLRIFERKLVASRSK